jgi:hypothetical protein
VEYRNVAGTLEDEHARRSMPAVKSAWWPPRWT